MQSEKTPKVFLWGIFGRREFLVLAGILLAGLLLRLSYLDEIRSCPDFSLPLVDAGFHDYWARAIVSGDWADLPEDARGLDPQIQSRAYFRPPGYPYFLALIYSMSGSGYLAARAVQMVLGLVNGVLLFFLGRRLFGSSVGLLAAGGMSFYWIFIYYEGKLQAPVLLIFLVLCLIHACLLMAQRITWIRAGAVGLLLGLFALVRPNILLFAPVILAWGWWLVRRKDAAPKFRVLALGVIAGTVLAISPAAIRNFCVSGDLVLISSNGGVSLYIGNNEFANGRFVNDAPELEDFGTTFDYPRLVSRLENKLGRSLSYSEASQYFVGRSMAFIKAHPGDFFRLLAKKAALFWGPEEFTHNHTVKCERRFSKTLGWIPGDFALVLALALVGGVMLLLDRRGMSMPDRFFASDPQPGSLLKSEDRWPVILLIFLFLLTYFVSFVPFFATSLYRVPLIPFLLLFGAVGVHGILRHLCNRSMARALCYGGGGMLFLGMMSLFPGGGRDSIHPADLSRWHFTRGLCFERAGRSTEAAKEYREAIRASDGNFKPRYNLARLLEKQGCVEKACLHYEAVLRIKPDFYHARLELADLCTRVGRWDDAAAHFAELLERKPRDMTVHFKLANALTVQGRLNEAIREYGTVLRSQPDFADAHSNLGVALARLDRFDEAIEHYRESLRINPRDGIAQSNMGIALSCQGRFAEAAASQRRALDLDPEDETARKLLNLTLRKMEERAPSE